MSFVLNAEDLSSINQYLRERKWIAPDEELKSASKPGEGNMNYVLRLRTSFRTFIIKQARPYVEKYPQIPAPTERALIEAKFYELIQKNEVLRRYTPELSNLDEENFVLTLEDLGESSDYTYLYQKGKTLEKEDLNQLMRFLSILHGNYTDPSEAPILRNLKMRSLNAEHIFHYPFLEQNGFDLDTITPGLQEEAMSYKTDRTLKAEIKSLSQSYLSDGNTLLHGDYYPGSWLKTFDGIKIIDPEFSFFGPAEFDISIVVAHLMMAQAGQELLPKVLAVYDRRSSLDLRLLDQLTGIEIMRRIIGLAQLPLSLSLEEKSALLIEARNLILG